MSYRKQNNEVELIFRFSFSKILVFLMQLDPILNTYRKARLQFSMQGFSLTVHIS